jgi:hypothetical protein
MFGTSTHSYWNEQMLGMVGQVVHEDYHREFVRIRDHLVEKPLRARRSSGRCVFCDNITNSARAFAHKTETLLRKNLRAQPILGFLNECDITSRYRASIATSYQVLPTCYLLY